MAEWRYSPTNLRIGTGWSVQLHASAAFFPAERATEALDRRLGGPLSRSGRYGANIFFFLLLVGWD
jgi:hypothetical protein